MNWKGENLLRDEKHSWETSDRGVESSLIDLDMFRDENDDRYTSLQTPISILEAIQVVIVVGGILFMLVDLIIVGSNGRGQDAHDSMIHIVQMMNLLGQVALKAMVNLAFKLYI